MNRETTPTRITDKIMELCRGIVPEVAPIYVPVEAAGWSQPHECFPNVHRMVQEHGGQQVNGWAIWQWANILIDAEAHSVWESPDGCLRDITPHDYGEQKILFLRDDGMVYSGKRIGSVRQALTESSLVAEYIRLINEGDQIMDGTPGKMCKIPTSLMIRLVQISEVFHSEVDRNAPCPCQSGLKYKKCCGRSW